MSGHTVFSMVFDMLQKILLSIDPYAFDSFSSQNRKTIKIQISHLGEYYLRFDHKALSLIENPSHSVDCELSGSLSAYLDIIFKYKRFVPGKGIHISGQTAVAQTLFKAFQNLDPDWASQFEKRLPKPLVALGGHIIAQLKHGYQNWQRERTKDIKSYLQNETTILVPRAAFQQFSLEVKTLQNKITKLEQQYKIQA